MINRTRKSTVKTQVRKFTDAVSEGDAAKAETELKTTCKILDQVSAKGALHKNTVSRTKSRLQRRLNALKAGEK